VTPLPADRWAHPTPAPGWTIAHQIAHLLWTDRVALTAVTDDAAFAEVLAAATADPVGFVDAGAEELTALAAGRVARRLAGDPRPVAQGAADGRRWTQIAVVRAADERGFDGDRAVDGDLGART